MKNTAKLLLGLFIIFVASSCVIAEGIEGNGNVIKKKIEITEDFNAITVSQGINVILTQNSIVSVEAEMDENLFALLETKVINNELKISFKKNIKKSTKRTVYISVKEIVALSVSSAARIKGTNKLNIENLILNTSSAGKIELDLIANSINSNISSASKINLKGSCQICNIEASSGSKFEAKELKAKQVVAKASSAAKIQIFATESIDAKSSSAANIICYGNPQKRNASKSSAGSIVFE